jgi:threonine synthase
MWKDASTLASGLRVPKPYGDYLILDILNKSGGAALAVSDDEIMDAMRHWAQVEGVFAAPEGAASLVAYQKLRERDFFSEDDVVVLFNTGTGLKYLDTIEQNEKPERAPLPEARSMGGIIGPY